MCTALIGTGLTGTKLFSQIANTLAYFAEASVTKKKSFIALTTGMSNNEAHLMMLS